MHPGHTYSLPFGSLCVQIVNDGFQRFRFCKKKDIQLVGFEDYYAPGRPLLPPLCPPLRNFVATRNWSSGRFHLCGRPINVP